MSETCFYWLPILMERMKLNAQNLCKYYWPSLATVVVFMFCLLHANNNIYY